MPANSADAGQYALAHNGWRTSNFINSFPTERAITILNALVGNWGVTMFPAAGEATGGLGTPPQPPYPRVSALRLDGVPWKYPFVPLTLGIFQQLRDAIIDGQPYQAHGWFISRQNPVLSLPDRQRTLQAMSKLDFIVTIDIIMNDTSWFSDVVLPEASYLERFDPLLPVGNGIFVRQPVIEPQGEARSALWIYKELGKRLGLGDFFQYKDEEDYLAQQLAPLGKYARGGAHAAGLSICRKGSKVIPSPGRRPVERSKFLPALSRPVSSTRCRSGRSRPNPRMALSTCLRVR